MFNLSQYFPITDPTLIFLVVLLVILFAPIIMGKLRIPHIIGFVLAGVILGTFGLNILTRDSSFEIFGNVGLYYIMFLAALELDLESFRKLRNRVLTFGIFSFLIPFALTWMVGIWILGYETHTSFLLSCIMSASTLIAYPVVVKYGLQQKESVALSVGATMIALVLSLVALAGLVASFEGNNDMGFWLVFTVKFAAYCGGMVFFLPRMVRWFLRRYSDSVMQFTFVLSLVFLSGALSHLIGLEGIFGAFLAGLILNRYIPGVSLLMSHIEFIGNALFIPYFLTGVGMLVNIRVLFQGGEILWVVLWIVLIGTLGKGVAAYLTSVIFKMKKYAGQMMFGLTSAHAACAIAMVLVGIRLEIAPGQYLVDDAILNGVVIMILFTCVISSLVTERAAQQMTLKENQNLPETYKHPDEEKILIPVKYPEYADSLIDLAVLVRDNKLSKPLVALNVVYDDEHVRANQEQGKRLLQNVSKRASASNVVMETQVRIAANIANGIKHAYKEFQAGEIIIGMHQHSEVSTKFWGQFHQSLFNGLNCQIMMTRTVQPWNTLRQIQVAVPSRAQFEPGFYRWLERLSRLAVNLECRITFNGRDDTLELMRVYIQNHYPDMRVEYHTMKHWNELPKLAATIRKDHLFVVVTARKGTISYKNALEKLSDEIKRFFSGKNILIIFPDQFGASSDTPTLTRPQHTEESSAYEDIGEWIKKKLNK